MQTTLSDAKMKQVADLVEEGLKQRNITYTRNGTIFQTTEPWELLNLQAEAIKKLYKNGVITDEDIHKELKQFL